MTMSASLRAAWVVAETAQRKGALRAAPIPGVDASIRATATDSGEKGLVVAVRPDESLAAIVRAVARQTESLGAEISRFNDGGRQIRALHVWCKRDDLLEAFAGFCDPFIARCAGGESVEAAFAACLEEFRRLLGGSGPTDQATVTGLLGELLVLAQLLEITPKAFDWWAFPSLERHDFRNGRIALETKTTLRSEHSGRAVRVTSIDQLDPPRGGALYLHWVRLERDPSGSVTLESLGERIAGVVGPPKADDLWRRIETVAKRDVWNQYRFSVQEQLTFRISPEFPRLSPSRLISASLDPGVARVTYDLDLAFAAKDECQLSEACAELLRAAGQQP